MGANLKLFNPEVAPEIPELDRTYIPHAARPSVDEMTMEMRVIEILRSDRPIEHKYFDLMALINGAKCDSFYAAYELASQDKEDE